MGSVEAKCTVPLKSVTRLPWTSAAVTVGVSNEPATVEPGRLESSSRAAVPCRTSVEAEPAMVGRTVSAAETDCVPAVPNCTETVLTPRFAGTNKASGMGNARGSLPVK